MAIDALERNKEIRVFLHKIFEEKAGEIASHVVIAITEKGAILVNISREDIVATIGALEFVKHQMLNKTGHKVTETKFK